MCLVLDRIQARRVLARNIAEAARQNSGVLPPMPWGPSMGLRLWRSLPVCVPVPRWV